MTNSWPSRLALAAVFLTTLLFALRQNTDPDLGFHLNTGRWIAEHHSVPQVDEFTYTAQGRPYLDPHWLYQTVLYGAYRLGGFRLLTLMNAALILLLFFLLDHLLRRAGTPAFLLPGLLLPAAFIMEMRFEIRPEVLSWVLLALTMTILEHHRRGDPRALRFLPFVVLLWVNVEVLFILAFAVLGIHLVGGRIQSGRWDKPLLKWSGLSLLAAFVNPYGLQGAWLPFKLWSYMTDSVFAVSILEMRKPWDLLLHPDPGKPLGFRALYYPWGIASLLLLILTRRKRPPADFLLWGAFFLLSVTAVRNIPLFIIATLPLTGRCLSHLLPARLPRDPGPRWSVLVMAFALLMGSRIVTGAHYSAEKRLSLPGWGIQTDAYPERAVRFLERHRLTRSRIVNDIPAGDWLPWRCGVRVMADGRLKGISEVAFEDILCLRVPGGLASVVAKHGATLVVADPETVYRFFPRQTGLQGWRTVFVEDCAAILAAPEVAARLPAFDWDPLLSERGILKPGPGEVEGILSRDPVSRSRDWLEGFFRRKEYPYGLWVLAAAARGNERWDVAETLYLEVLRRTRGTYPEIYFNLGEIYERTGRPGLRDLCTRRLAGETP